ncbi:MAG: hypothetical protein AAGK32_21630 [Actinomycetota bacterium]
MAELQEAIPAAPPLQRLTLIQRRLDTERALADLEAASEVIDA